MTEWTERRMYRASTLQRREGVAVHQLQFETTAAIVMAFVVMLGIALIALLQVASF
jgi:hypothetical protein